MRESGLVRKIKKAVEEKYPRAYCRKLADRFTRGLPDLLILVPVFRKMAGRVWGVEATLTLMVETKTQDGRLSPIQIAEHEAITKSGGVVLVARDVETVLAYLEEQGAIQ